MARVRLAGFALMAVSALAAVSCQPDVAGDSRSDVIEAPLRDFNLVFIVIDALRADHLGAYGYARNTSPFLDSLADTGVLFERSYSSSSFTRESISALLTGKNPSASGSFDWKAEPALGEPTLGTVFRKAGYRTGFFSESPMVNGESFTAGFAEVENFELNNQVRGHAPKLSQRALAFAKENAEDRFLMYVHYLDPHGEYSLLPNYTEQFVKKPTDSPITLYARRKGQPTIRDDCARLVKAGFGPGNARYEEWMGRYDAEIRFVDDAVKTLVHGLEALGVMDRTLIVVTSDHGEEFLEHDFVEHGWTLYEESVQVPLIFYSPKGLPAHRFDQPVSAVDVLPTILELSGIPFARETLDGATLFAVDSKGILEIPRELPIVIESHIRWRNSVVALIDNDWKYVAWQSFIEAADRPDAIRSRRKKKSAPQDHWFHLDAPIVKSELYNLRDDPGETRNLKDAEPEEFFRLQTLFEQYREEWKEGLEESPLKGRESTDLSPEEIERLKSLGYL